VSDDATHLSNALADRYRIERELGAGGMATVYLAHDLKHDRKVAIKVLKPELAAALGHDRFLREITTTANLRHPHILPLYDSGEAGHPRDGADGWFLFYAMPFVEGETLRDRLSREKQLPLNDALQIAREVADALSYAHGRGVIHRDIKPENILLESGHAVVADFGIARAVSAAGKSSLTQAGMAIGTPAYMSPEQAAGEQDLDGRSDLYALGCVTYEMLAGQPPFTSPTVESLIHQHLVATPRPLTQLRSAVPVAVADAVQRALAKNPADRFASLSEFSAALRADAQSGAVQLPRLPRRRTLAGFAAVAVLAIVLVAWLGRRHGKSDVALDPNVIAVLPFRVGGDPAVGYLRESMLDLLQARLSGGAGTRTVEPRTLLAAWRRAVGSESEDLSEKASRALATELGAGRLLLGSAIATPTELTLSGSLVRVGDGVVLARESVAGAPDSIAVLVNRLTSALLIRDAGESGERRVGLAAAPLDALQDYLAGRKAYRRGDYFTAMSLYGRALDRDSTFVEAAFGMVATNAWIGTVFTTAGYRVIPNVWRMRDRLGARDLGLFLAMPMVGPNYPRPSDYAAIIAQAERAASQASDSPEHWLLLGQLLTSYGAAASRRDWRSQGVDALDRAVALDSSFSTALGARLYSALSTRDRPTVAHLAGLLESRVAEGFTDDFLLWAAARSRGDSAAALRWRDRSVGLSRTDFMQKLVKISLFSVQLGLPLADARWAPGRLRRDAATDQERGGSLLADFAVRFAEGRTGLVDQPEQYGPGWVATVVQQALIEPAYRSMAARLLVAEAGGGYRLHLPSGGEMQWPPLQLCLATLMRSAGGDTSGTGPAITGLRRFAALEPPPLPRTEWEQIETDVCPLLLDVLREKPPKVGVRWTHLEELDSIMQRGPRGFSGAAGFTPTAFANYTIARLREAQGEVPAALAAIRRRESDGFPAYLWSRAAFLRQEGRLAALVADTAGATLAYDEYLVLRTDPDLPLRAQRDSVVAERAALARRPSRALGSS
jgi:tetratricopeptide (TPR) repeat protein